MNEQPDAVTPGGLVVDIKTTENSMQRAFGAMPGGGMLYVHKFSPDEFGSIGARALLGVVNDLKAERKKSFTDTKAMLKALKLIGKGEEVQSVSIGSDKLGNEQLIVVSVIPGGPE